jgi:hypothetical protein
MELKQIATESWVNADSWQEFNGFPFRNTASDVSLQNSVCGTNIPAKPNVKKIF